jgi:hypothetical protein
MDQKSPESNSAAAVSTSLDANPIDRKQLMACVVESDRIETITASLGDDRMSSCNLWIV